MTPWTVAHQAPLSMGFSRQEYWSGLPCPSPENLPDPGMDPSIAGGFFTSWATKEAHIVLSTSKKALQTFLLKCRIQVSETFLYLVHWEGKSFMTVSLLYFRPVFLSKLKTPWQQFSKGANINTLLFLTFAKSYTEELLVNNRHCYQFTECSKFSWEMS